MNTWPDADPLGYSAPKSIEGYLKSTIRSENPSLLGEIDLQTPRDYAGIDWSLLDLANYQISKRVILKDLDAQQHQLQFPATLTIWAVGHAQMSDEGGKLWDLLDDYSQAERSKIAKKFTQAMDLLNFDLFIDELQEAQKHAQLASIHAMIPDFAIPKFGQVVGQGVRLNRPADQILEEILHDPTISKGVSRLFSARHEMGLDLVARTFDFIAYGHEVDLPERILNKISMEKVGHNKNGGKKDFPEVRFYEPERRPIILVGNSGWILESQYGEIIEPDLFPPVQVSTYKRDGVKILLVDPSVGYLVFNENGKLLRGKKLPEHAGYILWSKQTRILTNVQDLDEGYLIGSGWDEWQYAYFQKVEKLELATPNGQTTALTRSEKLKIDTNAVPHLVDADGHVVFSSFPIISSGQNARVTDNIQNLKYRLDDSGSQLGAEPYHYIDFTVSAGLGRSSRIQGIVAPGLTIQGLENALIEGEKRELTMSLANGWHFSYPAPLRDRTSGVITVDADIPTEIVEFVDPEGNEFTTYLEVPVLSWSLVFNDRENQITGSETKLLLEDRSHIEALILNNVDQYKPLLKVGASFSVGKQRGRNVFYDLRRLQQDRSMNETIITSTWNYREINLLSFRKIERRKPILLNSLKDLGTGVVEAGLFTIEDLAEYNRAKQEEHIKYRDRLRSMRGRH